MAAQRAQEPVEAGAVQQRSLLGSQMVQRSLPGMRNLLSTAGIGPPSVVSSRGIGWTASATGRFRIRSDERPRVSSVATLHTRRSSVRSITRCATLVLHLHMHRHGPAHLVGERGGRDAIS